MRTKPVRTNRVNQRNEVITLRALLKVAVKALHDNGCMLPKELTLWLRAQRAEQETVKMKAEITVDMAHEVRNA